MKNLSTLIMREARKVHREHCHNIGIRCFDYSYADIAEARRRLRAKARKEGNRK